MTIIDCKAVLFDLDGTLVDSRESIDIAYKAWCVEHGLDFEDVLEKAHGRRTIDSVRILVPHRDPLQEAKKLEELECAAVKGLVAISGAKELLNHLSFTHWAIVTSGSRRLASHRLSYCGIQAPPVFITADDVTKGKPDPEGYMKAADMLGVDYADCVVFEDAPAGIKAARAANMRSIAMPTTHSLDALGEADYRVPDLHKMKIQVNGSLRIIISDLA